jgi:peptidoglycan biosynthesis protein MviN/MurJ (putative lipid II flippase)
MTRPSDPARARYFTLSLMRVMAALMIVAGMVLAFGERDWLDRDVAIPLGYGLIALGFFDLLILLPMLLRRWKSGE